MAVFFCWLLVKTCPVKANVQANTGQFTFYKVPEKQRHVELVTLYEQQICSNFLMKHFFLYIY